MKRSEIVSKCVKMLEESFTIVYDNTSHMNVMFSTRDKTVYIKYSPYHNCITFTKGNSKEEAIMPLKRNSGDGNLTVYHTGGYHTESWSIEEIEFKDVFNISDAEEALISATQEDTFLLSVIHKWREACTLVM